MAHAHSQSITDALRSDHRAIRDQVDAAVEAAETEGPESTREQLVMMLVRHFVAEEQYLYPTMREVLEDGAALADEGLAADRSTEDLLRRLEDPELTGAEVARTLDEVRTAFAQHVVRQERDLGSIEVACSPEQLTELGEGVIGAEQIAPTRPRGFAPESVAANKVVSFVEGFLDQVRDHYTRRGADSAGADAL